VISYKDIALQIFLTVAKPGSVEVGRLYSYQN